MIESKNVSGPSMCIEIWILPMLSISCAVWETEDGKDASTALSAHWTEFAEVVLLELFESLRKQSFSEHNLIF